jgi:hypothetical protein
MSSTSLPLCRLLPVALTNYHNPVTLNMLSSLLQLTCGPLTANARSTLFYTHPVQTGTCQPHRLPATNAAIPTSRHRHLSMPLPSLNPHPLHIHHNPHRRLSRTLCAPRLRRPCLISRLSRQNPSHLARITMHRSVSVTCPTLFRLHLLTNQSPFPSMANHLALVSLMNKAGRRLFHPCAAGRRVQEEDLEI